MQFTRLRIFGFKSFVEPTELVIYPGLTGVVGPNGCGKSNLVEALRWVMGETSAKNVRGAAMDDVIFAGTANRPARNVAEVALHLDNSERHAPAAFNNTAELEVVRRIERDQGSAYFVNGHDVRARDVQLLFADLVTGAHSPAMVSQGRVAALIGAKPADRRRLLEEAAGVTGLHSRRHEAELKLRAAEQNLARVDDVITQLDAQLQGLKRQARQANRYRNLSGYIRKAEALRFHLLFVQAESELTQARSDLAASEALVGEAAQQLATAQAAELAAGERLPPLRQAEAEAGARLHRLAVARDGLEAERVRADENLRANAERLAQIDADLVREQMLARDAAEALAKLAEEAAALEALRAEEGASISAALGSVDRLGEAVAACQAELDRAGQDQASALALYSQLNAAAGNANERIARMADRLSEIAAEREGLDILDQSAELTDAEQAAQAAKDKAQAAREHVATSEAERVRAQAAAAVAREIWQGVQGADSSLRAEVAGLAQLLSIGAGDLWPPLIDAVRVEAGYEKALGVALGEDLSAPANVAAPVHWDTLDPLAGLPPLPAGARPLTDFVTAPPALARRLAMIGVVEEEAGSALRRQLAPGQRLVSRQGSLWRWDGFTVQAGALTQSSSRLESRNRLAELRRQLSEIAPKLALAEAEVAATREAAEAASDAEIAARELALAADNELAQAREQVAEIARASGARNARLLALQEAAANAESERAEAQTLAQASLTQLAALPELAKLRDNLDAARLNDQNSRDQLAEARLALEELRRQSAHRAERLGAIGSEAGAWNDRAAQSVRHIGELQERKSKAVAEQAELALQPEAIAARQVALLDHLSEAEAARASAADALVEAETRHAGLGRETRAAQTALGEVREMLVRRQERVEHSTQARSDLALQIQISLEAVPGQLLEIAEIGEGEEVPALAQVDARVDRLKKERDTMGPVNLLAETEATEVGERLTGLQTERSDLVGAIERLRQGISSLNREGRERLLTAFKEVDQHFQELFKRLFGGGRAHLTLTESDDPLEAGLEIMASPPGKRLQVLSLLSGGEQALTALAMLFAMFLTNPAPICVLDEVDAPLDDANVDRLCNLMSDMARRSNTRFLIITHNPITMARMDRLFGVTMTERGISMLTSVDLAGAEALRATA